MSIDLEILPYLTDDDLERLDLFIRGCAASQALTPLPIHLETVIDCGRSRGSIFIVYKLDIPVRAVTKWLVFRGAASAQRTST